MKRRFLKDFDWASIQVEYDTGISLRSLAEKLNVGSATLARGSAQGLLKTRSISEAMQLSLANNPRDYSEQRNKRSSLANYRADCRFKFDLKQFPLEFDFGLIEKHGWYSPTNKNNNLLGVSRDHKVSVRYGFDNAIDPRIIAHPANCKLMLHSQNVSKYASCSITLDELTQLIVEWDKKYLGV